MTLQQIADTLSRHGIPYRIEDGRIYADTMEAYTVPFAGMEDLTEYTPGQLRDWLGY